MSGAEEWVSKAVPHATTSTIYPAMKAVEGLDAIEIVMERERVRKNALQIAMMCNPFMDKKKFDQAYDDATAKLVRNRLHAEKLKEAIRRNHELDSNVHG